MTGHNHLNVRVLPILQRLVRGPLLAGEPANLFGEIREVDERPQRKRTRLDDDVLQLPNVAGPAVIEQAIERLSGIAQDRALELRGVVLQRVLEQSVEILRPISKRWQVEWRISAWERIGDRVSAPGCV